MRLPTLGHAVHAARQRIDYIDARALLCHVIDRSPAYLAAHSDAALTAEQAARYSAFVNRRAAGEPVAYLLGEREFYGRTFQVTPAVLIPRPETELLVDRALERIAADHPQRVLDLGTGSGCVALTIASERLRSEVLAIDQRLAALAVARLNARALGIHNVRFLQSDWFSELAGERFDLIVSNPPYVATGDWHLDSGDVRFEPRCALEAGEDGLEALRRIVDGARRHLTDGGWLLLEHGCEHAAKVRALLLQADYADVVSRCDIAGIERVTGGRLTVAQARR